MLSFLLFQFNFCVGRRKHTLRFLTKTVYHIAIFLSSIANYNIDISKIARAHAKMLNSKNIFMNIGFCP